MGAIQIHENGGIMTDEKREKMKARLRALCAPAPGEVEEKKLRDAFKRFRNSFMISHRSSQGTVIETACFKGVDEVSEE